MGIVFSLLAAMGYGSSYFFTQMGLKPGRISSSRGMFINLVVANIAIWSAFFVALLFQPVVFAWNGVLYFVGAGLMAPLLGRYTSFMCIERIGAARGSSLLQSENLFAAPLAFVLFGQRLSPVAIVGIIVLVTGVILFIQEMRRSAAQRGNASSGGQTSNRSGAHFGIALGIAGGFFFAGANLLRQAGVQAIPSALLGSAIGTLVALLVVLVDVAIRGQLGTGPRGNWRDMVHFALSGITTTLGMMAVFSALDHGSTVAVASAIKNTSPLFTFALLAIFVRKGDRITRRLVLRIAVVVAGGVITTLGRLY